MSSEKTSRARYENRLIFACFFLYLSMMVAKAVYSAELVELIEVFGTDRAHAALPSTFYYITYAGMQIVLAAFVFRRVNIPRYLFITVCVSAILTVTMALATGIVWFWVVFGIGGIMQAGVWAGSIGILSRHLSPERMAFGNKAMSAGYAVGTASAYLLTALCLEIADWRAPFLIGGGLFLLSAFVFYGQARAAGRRLPPITVSAEAVKDAARAEAAEKASRVETAQDAARAEAAEKASRAETAQDAARAEAAGKAVRGKRASGDIAWPDFSQKKHKIVLYLVSPALATLGAFAYYGIMNWVPNMLYEIFGLPKSISLAVSVLPPILTMFGPMATINLSEKRNPYTVALVVTALSTVFPLLLIFFYRKALWLSLLSVVFFLVMIYGARVVYGSVISFKLRDRIDAGGFCAVSNAFASVGAGVAPTLIGALVDASDWRAAFVFTTVCNLLTVAILAFFLRYVGKHAER